jgi:transcriptional regulator with XRE-family HTH domain
MINIAALLDKAKVIHSLKSDYKLALVMGVQQSSLRNYRTGKTLPDERVIGKICELTGDDPGLLLAEIEAQRAKSDEARAMWSDIAKRLTAAAAAGIVSASVLAGPTLPPPATGDGLYIMLSGKFSHTVRLRRRAHTRKALPKMAC